MIQGGQTPQWSRSSTQVSVPAGLGRVKASCRQVKTASLTHGIPA